MDTDASIQVDNRPQADAVQPTAQVEPVAESQADEPAVEASHATPTTGRSLRIRLSAPGPTASPKASVKGGPPKYLEVVKQKIGPEGVKARREEVVQEKEATLRDLVDGHDSAVREKFHLERYISLLEGWDPEVSTSRNHMRRDTHARPPSRTNLMFS